MVPFARTETAALLDDLEKGLRCASETSSQRDPT